MSVPFPTVVSETGFANSGEGTTFNINYPSGLINGNLVLAMIATQDAANIVMPAGWTLLQRSTSANTGFGTWIRTIDGTEGSFFTVTQADARRVAYIVYQIGMYDFQHTPPYASATPSTTLTPPSLTPSWGSASNLWITAIGYECDAGQTGTSAYPSGYSDGTDFHFATNTGNGAGCGISACNKQATASSDTPGAFTTNCALQVTQTIAIRPGPGPAGGGFIVKIL